MKIRLLLGRTCLFAAAFFPLHVAPPVLSHPQFSQALGQGNALSVALAYHLGFAVAAATMLMRGPHALAIVERWRVAVLVSLLAGGATLLQTPSAQIIGRMVLGASAVVLLANFYRDLKRNGGYEQLPLIFGVSALGLESGGLAVGLVVERWGITPALGLSWALLVITGIVAVAALRQESNPLVMLEPVQFNFSGSVAFMAVAILAYGGFFLMLLSLSTLDKLPNGSTVSGLAIFSTAFAFSSGNLLPLEKLKAIGSPTRLVLLGTACSSIGSLVLWYGLNISLAVFIVVGAATVAFGNGITISRSFQRASLVSTDGYSGSILTMLGVMSFTVMLTLVSGWIGASAPMMQTIAFLMALGVIIFHGLSDSLSATRV
ncbi:MAG: hypothetical protein ABIT70_12910 [Sulfuriferula sp.]